MLRVQKEALAGSPVIDVDGSYLYRKQQRLLHSQTSVCAPLPPPTRPLKGWESVTATNVNEMAKKIPRVMPGTAFIDNIVDNLDRYCFNM